MQSLPKIVRDRLQVAPQSDHPDADALTAFTERSLPASERTTILEHLAYCGDCREVLALALPEIETDATVAPVALRRPWLTMPILRWGAIAAGFAVIAAIGVMRYRQRGLERPASYVASSGGGMMNVPGSKAVKPLNDSAGDAQSTQTENHALLVMPQPANPSVRKKMAALEVPKSGATTKTLDLNKLAPIAGALPAAPPPQATDGLNSESKEAGAGGDSVAKNERSSSPVLGQSQTVEVSAASPMIATEPSSVALNQPAQVAQSKPQMSNPGATNQDALSGGRIVVGKAKAPVAAEVTGGAVAGGAIAGRASAALASPAASPRAATSVAPNLRWMITSEGRLRRSYDQGATWQDVSVAATAHAAVALQEQSGARSAAKAAQPAAQNASSSPVFRAISVSGVEIWAGASAGVLYHSVDAGDHWTSSVPSDHDIPLTGDIVSVEFTDAAHGKIATSSMETWSTADAGQHWSKQ